MSKICTVCGYYCEDYATACPVCGSPFSVSSPSSAPASTVPEQKPEGISSQQTATPSQAVPSMQSQSVTPVPGAASIPQAFVQQTVYTPYPQSPSIQGQGIQGMPEAPKKKSKTLWIILGIVGGILLLLIILAIILGFALKNVWNGRNNPSTQTPASISHSDHHEYYYADYDSASFQSEAFVDVTTEDPSSISTEESVEPEDPFASDSAGDFREEDLMLYSVEAEGVEPYAYAMEENYCYTISSSTGLLQTGSGSLQEPAEFQNKQCQLGRGIQTGSSTDECINAYGVDTTNAIWQLYENDTFEYYYYSTTVKPDYIPKSALLIGWYQNGDTWQRMYPVDLFNYWQNGTPPECDRLLMYILYVDNSNDSISSMNILYGNSNYFQEFYTSWTQLQNPMNETE
ncbi:MAG: hypothetical protein NC089_09085 [Bacteroides sp.]|nr:hypothetical protein [Bacteroides sp.]MCM1550996.1 hypothetical protein [Clostridium sp.]